VGTAVDASVVIAFEDPGHPSHTVATDLLGDAEPPLYMSELTLAEVLVGLDPAEWVTAIGELEDVGFVSSDPKAEDIAHVRLACHLRMPDACVIATARAETADTVLSFDATLLAAAQKLGFATNTL
jgi:predicted nucleic acid-binding protein